MTRAAPVLVTAFASCVLLLSGCYTTASVPPAALVSLRGPLSAPKALDGGARLGPRSELRVRRTDGSVTPWFPAATLAIGANGLVTGDRYPLRAATDAVIAEADEGATMWLSAMAPPGSEVTPTADGARVRVPESRLLLPWLSAYATGVANMHGRPGRFSFRSRRDEWETGGVPASVLVARPRAALSQVVLADGILWHDVAGIEVQNMNPLNTTGAIIGMPIAMAFMMLGIVGTAAAIVDGDDPTPALSLVAGVASVTSTAAEDGKRDTSKGDPVPLGGSAPEAVLVASSSDNSTGTVPLFSSSARRRDRIKLILAGEAGLDGASGVTASVGAGIRICDFVELTGRLRALSLGGDSSVVPTDGMSVVSPTVGLLGGLRLALHIDPDGNPVTSFVVGAEILGGSRGGGPSVTELGFVLGPRIGITDKAFVSLLVAPSLLTTKGTNDRPGGTTGQVMVSAEMGFDL